VLPLFWFRFDRDSRQGFGAWVAVGALLGLVFVLNFPEVARGIKYSRDFTEVLWLASEPALLLAWSIVLIFIFRGWLHSMRFPRKIWRYRTPHADRVSRAANPRPALSAGRRWCNSAPWKAMHFSGCNCRPAISRSFYQALLQHEDELLKTSPKDSLLLMFRFTALGEIDGIPNAKLDPAADMLLSALPQDPIL
jgi:hypothetical protein